MVGFYPLCAFGENRVAASIDTPLHAFLPFPHVDHLHPDWAIALAASANGAEKLEEFNQQYGRKIVWVPWQRPGFELALMLRQAVEDNPGCDGIILGGHGLFTWGETQHECYVSSITHHRSDGRVHPGARAARRPAALRRRRRDGDRRRIASRASPAILPYLRGAVSSNRRVIGALRQRRTDALTFANSTWAEELCGMGTSCPDHFLRTRISPMFVPLGSGERGLATRSRSGSPSASSTYREDYAAYYKAYARHGLAGAARLESVGGRHSGPRPVRVRQGQARGAHHVRVLRQRHPRDGRARTRSRTATRERRGALPQARRAEQAKEFKSFRNYVALPRREAFRIEYWALEEAKLQRMPPEKEFSRKVVVVVGGGSGIGREVALQIAKRGGHVVVADHERGQRRRRWRRRPRRCRRRRWCMARALDLTSRDTHRGGVPRRGRCSSAASTSVINTAAIYPDAGARHARRRTTWAQDDAASTSRQNYVLAEEAGEGSARRRSCRRRSCSRARRTRSCRRRAARRTTSARRRSIT